MPIVWFRRREAVIHGYTFVCLSQTGEVSVQLVLHHLKGRTFVRAGSGLSSWDREFKSI